MGLRSEGHAREGAQCDAGSEAVVRDMLTSMREVVHVAEAQRRQARPDVDRLEQERADVHLKFAAQVYREQVEGGRFFLYKHPDYAGSWCEPCTKGLLEIKEVTRVQADQCQYGQRVRFGPLEGQREEKTTGFMSNAPRILEKLTRRCHCKDGQCTRSTGGKHATANGRAGREAARHFAEPCRARVRVMIEEMKQRGIHRADGVGLHAVKDEDVDPDHDESFSGAYRDNISGQILRDDLVREA